MPCDKAGAVQKVTEVESSSAAEQRPQQAAAQASQPMDSGHGETQEKASAAVTPGTSAQAPHGPKHSQKAAEHQQGSEQHGERLRAQAEGRADAGAASSAASGPHGGAQQGRDRKAAARPMPSAAASQAGSIAEDTSVGKMPHTGQQVQHTFCSAGLHGTALDCTLESHMSDGSCYTARGSHSI